MENIGKTNIFASLINKCLYLKCGNCMHPQFIRALIMVY
jgi:hypothetical protein